VTGGGSAVGSTPRSRARYAAIDGYRGLFVILVMLYHFGVTALAGGWVGINHFFVFSGFLISRLLVKEHARTGRISALRFYIRRARRILPAMFVLVLAVVVHTALTGSLAQKKQYGGDAFATLGFFLNWRLISRNDQYFDMFSSPSPLRHCWTLAVEEQFYVLAPFILLAVCVLVRRRIRRALVAFALAAASTVWTAHLGYHSIGDQARLYYGTDTRAQALLVGVGMGLLLGVDRRGREPAQLSRSATHVLAWIGFLVSLGAIFVLSPTSAWVYNRGGMLLFALGAALMGFAAIDQRNLLINRIFGWRPLVYLGRISYGLYLYHWPIHLWLPLHALPEVVAGGIQLVLTLVVAALSFRYLELPVLQGGVRAVLRRPRWIRPVPAVAGVTAVLCTASLTLSTTASHAETRGTVQLVAGAPAYVPRATPITVGMFGDSVPNKMIQSYPASTYRDLHVLDLTDPGCDLVLDSSVQWTPTQITPPAKSCIAAHRDLGPRLHEAHARALTIFAGPTWPMPHKRKDGTVVSLSDPAYRKSLLSELDTMRKAALDAGVQQVQLVNLPCRAPDAYLLPDVYRAYLSKHPEITAAGTDPVVLNNLVTTWAHQHDVTVIDLYGRLCPGGSYRPKIHGVQLYADDMHFTPAGARMVWTWLAPTIRDDALRTSTSRG